MLAASVRQHGSSRHGKRFSSMRKHCTTRAPPCPSVDGPRRDITSRVGAARTIGRRRPEVQMGRKRPITCYVHRCRLCEHVQLGFWTRQIPRRSTVFMRQLSNRISSSVHEVPRTGISGMPLPFTVAPGRKYLGIPAIQASSAIPSAPSFNVSRTDLNVRTTAVQCGR